MKAQYGNNTLPTIEVTDSLSDVDLSVFAQYQERSLKAMNALQGEIINSVRIDKNAVSEFTNATENMKKLDIDASQISYKSMKP
jgi:hypothetical protein